MTSSLPILAQAAGQDSSAGLWITMGIVVLILAIFVGLLVYVAKRSRAHTPDPDDEN